MLFTSKLHSWLKVIIKVICICICMLIICIVYYNSKIPSNFKNWEFGQELLPFVTTTNETVTIFNVRNFSWKDPEITPTLVDPATQRTIQKRE